MNRRPAAMLRRRPIREQLIEAMQAQVVRAPFHAGRGERDAERRRAARDVLEEDLFLQVLGAGGNQHALAAQNGGDEIGERLAGAGAGFDEQDAAGLEGAATAPRHFDLAGARLEVWKESRERAVGREMTTSLARDLASPNGPRRPGYSG